MQAGQAGGARGTGRAVLERLVTVVDDVLKRCVSDQGFELLPGGDVHAALRNPAGLEAAGGANVEIGDELGG